MTTNDLRTRIIEPSGGAPGGYLYSEVATPIPTWSTVSPRVEQAFGEPITRGNRFVGDYYADRIHRITADLCVYQAGSWSASRTVTLQRTRWDVANATVALQATYSLPDIPKVPVGWQHYAFEIDARSPTVPRGWLLQRGDGTPATDADWALLTRQIDIVSFGYWKLGHMYPAQADRAQLVAGKLFYDETAPGEQVAKIMVRAGGKARVVVEPSKFDAGGHHASIDRFVASPDGRKLAFNVSTGGGEVATVHVLDLAAGAELADRVERVPGGLQVVWLPDSSGFFYSQKAAEGPGVDPMLNPQTRLHVLGRPTGDDVTVIGNSLAGVAVAPNEWATVVPTGSARWVLTAISGARSERRYVIAPVVAIDRSGHGRTPWRTVAEYADGAQDATVHGDRVYLQSYKEASNFRIVSVSAERPDPAAARVEIAEDPHATLVKIAAARDALYITRSVDGRARLLRWPWRGQASEIALPFDGWVGELDVDPDRDGVLFSEEGWTRPSAYSYDPGKRAMVPDALVTETNADYANIVADEVEAVSSDGTHVPLSILRRSDLAHDAARPAIVYGYAGYSTSVTPSFSPTRLAWLERGGIFAMCHGRGGGERGAAWHTDGAREHKMNGVHDFEACAQALVDARLSSPAHLFAQGGSMGGVLVGRAITDRPDLFAAAQIAVGVVNPLRLLAAKNGPTQIPEVGDPETEPGFRSLLAMDPYQHVTAAAYPATIFTIGLNDARVSPWMTGKMAARMQAQTTSSRPIAIRVDGDAGHGPGSTRDQAFTERADVWSFFLAASGDPAFAAR